MCAKFGQVVARLLPEGAVREGLKSSYYSLYYNAKHFKENDFYVYYRDGHFEYRFNEGVTFASYQNIADELKRSLRGYLAKHRLKSGETVIDCGAYTGEFTLYAAKAVGPSGKVIAFEPDPVIFRKLLANIRLNGADNVVALNKGVWGKPGVLKFVGDSIKGYSFMSAEKDASAIDVPVVSLDNELERLGITKVDFIKMDVEGAEIEAVRGAEKTLKGRTVDIAIASYHLIDGRKSCIELERMLPVLGYSAVTGHAQHLTTYACKREGGAL